MHPDPARVLVVPILRDLSDEQRAQVASWLDEETFDAGTRLTREGASDYEFFVIGDGEVEVTHEGKTLARLGQGDVFGELAILGGGRRRADVTAVTDVVLWSMFGTRFREMQLSMPQVAEALQALADERARILDER
jgi:CPA1 family monovalent cation:H+ antiporter